jgi:hypothetical protein
MIVESTSTRTNDPLRGGVRELQPSMTVDRERHRPRRQRSSAAALAYVRAALAHVPRLLGMVDRNPFHATYGCCDRAFWHYRTSDFPSGMAQEAVLPLAQVYTHPLPGNRWHRSPRLKELAVAGIRFAVRSAHADGSCDDYYPNERALGAAVFSLYACTEAYRLLGLHDLELLAGFQRRADWLLRNDETGQLANHQAIAALALDNVYRLTGRPCYRAGTEQRLRTLLAWQSHEGWFREYDGCDPGYLTVTIEFLAKYLARTGDPVVHASLTRAVRFARHFLHPDGSYGGEYGSRGTYHFYPHGMELLTADNAAAAALADGFLESLAGGTQAAFDDDRMVCHRLPSLLGAYLDWSPEAPVEDPTAEIDRYFPEARLYVRRSRGLYAVVAPAKGGMFKLYAWGKPPETDTGPVLETDDGRICATQQADAYQADVNADALTVSGPLYWTRHETATPAKMLLFRAGLLTAGRYCRNLVRAALQRRLITGERVAPVRFHRTLRWGPPVEVIDRIELTDPDVRVRRLALATDHSTRYIAAGQVYQESLLQPWTPLDDQVEDLNRHRRVTWRRVLA